MKVKAIVKSELVGFGYHYLCEIDGEEYQLHIGINDATTLDKLFTDAGKMLRQIFPHKVM